MVTIRKKLSNHTASFWNLSGRLIGDLPWTHLSGLRVRLPLAVFSETYLGSTDAFTMNVSGSLMGDLPWTYLSGLQVRLR